MPPRVANKSAQKPQQEPQPEIHLHGDIHVHTFSDIAPMVHVENSPEQSSGDDYDKKVGMSPVGGTSSPRMRFDVALEQLSTACDFLEDRINLLFLRTEPLRIQAQDSMPGAGPSGFANDESSNMMQMMNSIWHRVMIAGNRIDTVCSELET